MPMRKRTSCHIPEVSSQRAQIITQGRTHNAKAEPGVPPPETFYANKMNRRLTDSSPGGGSCRIAFAPPVEETPRELLPHTENGNCFGVRAGAGSAVQIDGL